MIQTNIVCIILKTNAEEEKKNCGEGSNGRYVAHIPRPSLRLGRGVYRQIDRILSHAAARTVRPVDGVSTGDARHLLSHEPPLCVRSRPVGLRCSSRSALQSLRRRRTASPTESPPGTVGTDSRVGPGDFAYLKNMLTFVVREYGKIALTQ